MGSAARGGSAYRKYIGLRDLIPLNISYNPAIGVGKCFGKHDRVGLLELADLLHVYGSYVRT